MVAHMARPRLPRVLHELPSGADRAAGHAFTCRACELEWPLRHRDPFNRLCINCGRDLRREQHTKTALKKAGLYEKQEPTLVREDGASIPVSAVMDPGGQFVSETDEQSVDAKVRRATMHKPRKPRGTGLVKT